MASKIRVAVLDDYTALSKPFFSALDPSTYDVTIFQETLRPYNHPDTPVTEKDKLATRLQDFQVICTMRERTPFPEALISRLPNLQLLLTTGLRNASLDLAALGSRGVPVAGTADRARGTTNVGTDSTTQHCVALILALARDLVPSAESIRSGGWQTGFATGLTGRTVGMVGLGRLGALVARICHLALGMKVVCWSENLTQDRADEKAREMGLPQEAEEDGQEGVARKTFKVVGREELFETADVVSLHLVLSDRTRGVVGADELRRMKKSAFLVNTSRGPLVKERDLLAALRDGVIRGAAIDVFELEPLPKDSEWRTTAWGQDGRSKVLLTPHMGYVEEGTLGSWYQQQVENIKRWKEGQELANPLK